MIAQLQNFKDDSHNTKETSENSRRQEKKGCGVQNISIQRKIRINPLPNILLKTEGQEVKAVQSKAISEPKVVFSTSGASTNGCPGAK